jgi:tetratricopeptide (TPR) repeat protein
MDVLCALAAGGGAVLSRERIIDSVWGRSFGADESLTRAISLLRKAFAPDTPIETVAKRGYRLTISPAADVAPRGTVVPRRKWLAATILALAVAVAAILFVTRQPATGGADGIRVETYLLEPAPNGARLAAALGDALARVPFIRVVDRTGRDTIDFRMGVGTMRADGRTQTTLRLSDANGLLVWSTRSAAPAGDDTRVDALAGQAGNQIRAAAKRALRAKPVESLRPWELVLLATWIPGDDEVFLHPHGPDAFYLQRRALELDPQYAPAHASWASGLAYQALFTSDADLTALQRQAARHADQARAMAPYDAGVLYELATYARLTGDRAAALAALQRVEALQPQHPLVAADRLFVGALCTGRAPDAAGKLRGLLDRHAADDPVRWVILSHLADLRLGAGDWAGAATDATASRQIVHQTWSGITLAAALAKQGNRRTSAAVAAETRLEWPRLDWTRFARERTAIWCLGGDTRQAASAFAAISSPEKR